jgi:hypothetical protein
MRSCASHDYPSLVELYLMHLPCAGSGPHEESGRRHRTVRAEVVPPLDTCAVEVLPHELGLSKAAVTQLLWCSLDCKEQQMIVVSSSHVSQAAG